MKSITLFLGVFSISLLSGCMVHPVVKPKVVVAAPPAKVVVAAHHRHKDCHSHRHVTHCHR